MSLDLRAVGAVSLLPKEERERYEEALLFVEKRYGDQKDLQDHERGLLIAEAKTVVQHIAMNRVFASKEQAVAQPIEAHVKDHSGNKIWMQLLTTAITSAVEAILNTSGVKFAPVVAPFVVKAFSPYIDECANESTKALSGRVALLWDC